MKSGDTVIYLGCSQMQINWGNNDDPRSYLVVGQEYVIEDINVHRQHTKVKILHKMGWFNSVCFELQQKEVNTIPLEKENDMDPSDIVLDSTSRMFQYEKLSREIESCNDIDELKNMCRCYIKLHLKHQEVAAQMMIPNATID